jgi:hypothetical protein
MTTLEKITGLALNHHGSFRKSQPARHSWRQILAWASYRYSARRAA